MKRSILLTVLFLFLASSAHGATRVEFILDVSGSMAALAGGEKKIDAAKKAIAQTVPNIPDGSQVALRLYGHRIPNQKKAESCKDSQLVIPFGPINKTQFQNALNDASPLGQTPIAYSLEQAAKDFGPMQDEEAVIILVSDGAETCGGDPAQVAKDLIAKGFKVKINTIGFDVDAQARAQLEAISQATGGQYMDAKDTAGLSKSLQELTQQSLVLDKKKSVYGEEIRGGDAYETAVPLTPGTLYRLDHHQKQNDFDYFYVDLKAGQKLVATIQTGEKGVKIRDGKAQENTNPYAGIQIHNAQKQKLVHETIIGSPNAKKSINVPLAAGQDGRLYVLVGNTYNSQNKDNPFQVQVIELFDAGTQQDAGDQEATALKIEEKTYQNYLHPNDKVDMFQFTAAPGTKYNLKARPTHEEVQLKITLFDADGVRLTRVNAPNSGAAVKLEDFEAKTAGPIFIKVENSWSRQPETEYTLTLSKSGSTESAPEESSETPEAKPAETPSAPPTAPAETAPAKPSPTQAPASSSTATGTKVQDSQQICLLIKGLPFLQKAKFYGMYVGIPLLAGWLIGMIWGYIKGRKTGKRKALATTSKEN